MLQPHRRTICPRIISIASHPDDNFDGIRTSQREDRHAARTRCHRTGTCADGRGSGIGRQDRRQRSRLARFTVGRRKRAGPPSGQHRATRGSYLYPGDPGHSDHPPSSLARSDHPRAPLPGSETGFWRQDYDDSAVSAGITRRRPIRPTKSPKGRTGLRTHDPEYACPSERWGCDRPYTAQEYPPPPTWLTKTASVRPRAALRGKPARAGILPRHVAVGTIQGDHGVTAEQSMGRESMDTVEKRSRFTSVNPYGQLSIPANATQTKGDNAPTPPATGMEVAGLVDNTTTQILYSSRTPFAPRTACCLGERGSLPHSDPTRSLRAAWLRRCRPFSPRR